jgi:beta-phosphoglucomutase-like phosphatase (HAD superfamily)
MLDSVLFEFEGVLADTAEARRDALLSALRADGIDVSEAEYREACAGVSVDDAVRAAFALRGAGGNEAGVAVAALRADRAYAAYLGKGVTLVEGAREVVERFLPVARLGIVTRASRREVEFVLTLARMEHAFTCVVAAEDAFPGKPSPAPYRAALERLERLRHIPARSLVVALEDGVAGIRAARGANLDCVAVGDLPAHVAMEAHALLRSITGLTPERLQALLTKSGEPIA